MCALPGIWWYKHISEESGVGHYGTHREHQWATHREHQWAVLLKLGSLEECQLSINWLEILVLGTPQTYEQLSGSEADTVSSLEVSLGMVGHKPYKPE